MALKPGGGRSPSTQTPPPPSSNGRHRPTRDRRTPETPRVASFSVLRWGALIGGLVIIADLSAQAIAQHVLSPDDLIAIQWTDEIVNYVLFSILGILVVRETDIIYMGAIAGLFAALLDGSVVAAAASMAPPLGPEVPIEELFVHNLEIGTLFAGLSGLVFMVVQRWSGRSRGR